MNPITLMLTALLANAIVTGVIVYLIQKMIERSYARQMEEFRASLQYANFEQQTKFSRGYQKTLDILETFHQKFHKYPALSSRYSGQLRELVSGRISLSKEEYYKYLHTLLEAIFDCNSYLQYNRIHLPDASVKELEYIVGKTQTLDTYLDGCGYFFISGGYNF